MKCWICGSVDTAHWKERNIQRRLVPDDFRITDSRYGTTLSLWRCRQCGFIFADGEELSELTSLYERLIDPDYEGSQESRVLQMRWLLSSALQESPKATSILDIGAGVGLLVAEARRMGLNAVGVEPSRSLVDSALAVNAVELLHGVFPHEALAGRSFDLIFVVDVIEHIANPLELLRQCQEALAPGGMVIVVTPDVGSMAARILGKRWWHFRLAHVGYFDRHSLDAAITAAGLAKVRQFRAKWFFRIGYLAERVAMYLPVAFFNRLALRLPPLRWLYNRVIPLNLRDSFVVLTRRVPVRAGT